MGNKEFIRRARRTRKLLGGGMRQAGILAAAGIVALEQMVERLAEDHEHCKRLANGLADYPQIDIDAENVLTDIAIFSLRTPDHRLASEQEALAFVERVSKHGVLMGTMGGGRIRAVTHYGIEQEDIDRTLVAIRHALIEWESSKETATFK